MHGAEVNHEIDVTSFQKGTSTISMENRSRTPNTVSLAKAVISFTSFKLRTFGARGENEKDLLYPPSFRLALSVCILGNDGADPSRLYVPVPKNGRGRGRDGFVWGAGVIKKMARNVKWHRVV